MDAINIIMASDDNYSKIMGVSIFSIFTNNESAGLIHIYIINDHIKDENINRLKEIAKLFHNSKITFVNFFEYEKKLEKMIVELDPPLPMSTYARLFISEMVDCDRCIYIDCDTICNNSIKPLWKIDIGVNIVAGVLDTVNNDVKYRIGVDKDEPYINAGVLLIDLKKWRNENITNRCMELINDYQGKVMHNDQGVINAVLKGRKKILDIQYNITTVPYMIPRKKIMRYFGMETYYSNREIDIAKSTPVIIHFVRFTTSRPWEAGCNHPQKDLYERYWESCYGEAMEYKYYSISGYEKIMYTLINNYPLFLYFLFRKITIIASKIKHSFKHN